MKNTHQDNTESPRVPESHPSASTSEADAQLTQSWLWEIAVVLVAVMGLLLHKHWS